MGKMQPKMVSHRSVRLWTREKRDFDSLWSYCGLILALMIDGNDAIAKFNEAFECAQGFPWVDGAKVETLVTVQEASRQGEGHRGE